MDDRKISAAPHAIRSVTYSPSSPEINQVVSDEEAAAYKRQKCEARRRIEERRMLRELRIEDASV